MGYQNRELREKIEKLCLDKVEEGLRLPSSGGPGCFDILGLVFLRYICTAAVEFRRKAAAPSGNVPKQNPGAGGKDTEDEIRNVFGIARDIAKGDAKGDARDAARDAGVFLVPESAAWDAIFPGPGDSEDAQGALQTTARAIAQAIRAIEAENPALKDVFPKTLTRPSSRPAPAESAGQDSFFPLELGRLLGGLSAAEAGQVFTELLREFEKLSALRSPRSRGESAPGRPEGGTLSGVAVPRGIAELLAVMLEPYQGRFCDPCCGSAGLLAGAADFVTMGQGKLLELSFYAQERNMETWRLAKMNLIVRGIDTTEIRQNAGSPLQRDLHGDIKFDFIAACPPVEEGAYPWIPYVLDRLSPTGLGALIFPRSSLNAPKGDEQGIRRNLVEGRLLDCVVNLPPRIFSSHSLSPCIWFFSRPKISRGRRSDETLFIDARKLGRPLNRRQWDFSGDDINRIARTYHNWRFPKAAPYRDIRSFAASAHLARIRETGYNLNPALYLGIPEEEEETGQGAHFAALRAEFEALTREEPRLSRQLVEALRKIRSEDLR
ncbi:MAG: SAM-dependent methyltransferase [Treponema sp.]|jgi:type I restriction enzyme M protein|nr:SAM-dependent methyltransferase [Treponema sp.]